MKITITASLGVLYASAHGGVAAESGFISLPLTRQTSSHDLTRRQTEASLSVAYHRNAYMVDVDIGTPKQRVQLAVDIAQNGVVVSGRCGWDYYQTDSECEKTGWYNVSASTTGSYLDEDRLGEQAADMPFERWKYYADDLTVAGQGTLENVTFRAWNTSQAYQHGFLGLGLGPNNLGGVEYPVSVNVLDALSSKGLIGSKAFGMTLDADLDTGSLIIGGVDTKKFSGALTKIPVVDAPAEAYEWEQDLYWLDVEGATLDSGNGTRTPVEVEGFKAMAKTDIARSIVPFEIVMPVWDALGVNWTDSERGRMPCSRAEGVEGSLELKLSGFTVSIPYADLLLPDVSFDAKEGNCYIAVMSEDSGRDEPVWSLGSLILRYVYAVFDQESRAVWMAEKADCGSEVVAFSKGEDVRGQCDGGESESGESSSDETTSGEGGSPNNDDSGSGGSRVGVKGALMLGAALMPLLF